MIDHIDEIIEEAGYTKPRNMETEFWKALRAVCEAAYRRGYESASLAHGQSDALARRKLARELLDYDAKNIEEIDEAPAWRDKSIVDRTYVQHSRMVRKLREIAEATE